MNASVLRVLTCIRSTTTAAKILSEAATRTDLLWPKNPSSHRTVANAANAEPKVLTKYSIPTERPTLPEDRTRCATRSGKVLPMNRVGTNNNINVTKPVHIGSKLSVNPPT